MKGLLAGLSLVVFFGGNGGAGDASYKFPADAGGRLLEKLLTPGGAGSGGSAAAGPRSRAGVAAVENPQVPQQSVRVELPRGKPEFTGKVQPRPLAEPAPLVAQDPKRPQLIELPAGQRVRLEVVDVNQPIPLPTFGQPTADRAPLTDPTQEASREAALASPIPERTAPAPFVRLNLPDPFEHSQAVRLRNPPAENPMPVVGDPRPPAK